MKISKTEAKKLFIKYNINKDVISLEDWHTGLNVECEHGSMISKLTNVTHDSKDIISKIVIAHILEFPNYYQYLTKMEQKLEKYWSKKQKPKSIFNE